MNWIIKICALLWSIWGVILLSIGLGIVANTTELLYTKIISIFIVIIIFTLSLTMYFSSLKIKKRKKYKQLHVDLIKMLIKHKYKTSLIKFAERNEVQLEFAQKYIDSILKYFNGMLDIDEGGMIIYSNKPERIK